MKKPPSYSIEYQQFNFKLTAKAPLILPAYKGSTSHGGFGYAFKRVVCATPLLSNQFNKFGSFSFQVGNERRNPRKFPLNKGGKGVV